ncbi:hypothetical protein J2S98_004574 [Arthrobacter oryzae]|nr:DUF2971 domain-containing protein [Arthrobacter sp. FW306-06-A]MDP9989384.1 hypothetical protein [Arthrobacter oryzae]UKA71441.1 DUF2971 domain-containing protein [Arthrobacter sp. FW306-06-A]
MSYLTTNPYAQEFNTASGMKTRVNRAAWPADRPPMTVQSGTAWHYTSLSAVESIVRSQELWATNWRATNDSTEFRHGMGFLKEAWDALQRDGGLDERTLALLTEAGPVEAYVDYFDDVHILCAAREKDSPYQWNSYASGSEGVALELDLRVPLVTDVDDLPRRRDAELFGFQWLKVVYSDRQKRLAAARFAREMDAHIRQGRDITVQALVALNVVTALNFKHEGFRHERETRSVALCVGVELKNMPQLVEKTIVPWKGMPGVAGIKRRPLPILEVMLGPRTPPEAAERVEDVFASADLPAVRVTRSSLPFR